MPPMRQKGFGKPKNAKKTIGRILQYMGKFKALWLVVFLCVIVSSGASVIGTYLIKPALNNYIIPMIGHQNPDFTGFMRLLLGVFALFIVGVFAGWCNSRLMIYISTNLLFNVRCDLFNRLEKLPIKYYDAHTHTVSLCRALQTIQMPSAK